MALTALSASSRSMMQEILISLVEIILMLMLLSVSYTHLRAHETDSYLVCRLLLEKKKNQTYHIV